MTPVTGERAGSIVGSVCMFENLSMARFRR
jgi:hypothetical protein